MVKNVIHFHYPILCDEVRREDNGKLICIGLYAGNVQMPMPGGLMMSLVIPCTANKIGQHQFEIRATLDREEKLRGKVSVDITEQGDAAIVVPNFLLPNIASEGLLKFAYSMDGFRWNRLRSIPILRTNNPN